MIPLLALFSFFIFTVSLSAQGDLLVLRKKHQTIQTWVPGSTLYFQFSSKQWIQGIIKAIRNDSLILEQIDVRQVPNAFGFPTIDTAKLGLMKLHVNEIYGIPRRNAGSDIFTNGVPLQLGSGAFIFLNIFNSLIKNDQVFSSVNLTRITAAGALFVLGTVLHTGHKTFIVLGKKYTIQTLHTGPVQTKQPLL